MLTLHSHALYTSFQMPATLYGNFESLEKICPPCLETVNTMAAGRKKLNYIMEICMQYARIYLV